MAAFRFFGEVERLYVHADGCNIRLQNERSSPPGQDFPANGYFQLRASHPNYDALYSLALLASSGRHRLQIRTTGDADPALVAPINYLVLDW